MTADLAVTCSGCPLQIEGRTDTGDSVYFRFRWGRARLYVNDEVVFASQYGDDMTGVMSDFAAMRLIHAVLDLRAVPDGMPVDAAAQELRDAHADLRADLPLGPTPPDADGQAWIAHLTAALPAHN